MSGKRRSRYFHEKRSRYFEEAATSTDSASTELATLVTTGRLDEDEAPEVARDLTYNLVKRAYKL